MAKRYQVVRTEMERCYGREIVMVDNLSAVQAHAYARGVVHGLTTAGWEQQRGPLLVVRDPEDGAIWHYEVCPFHPVMAELFPRDSGGYCLDDHGQRVLPALSPDRELERRMWVRRDRELGCRMLALHTGKEG